MAKRKGLSISLAAKCQLLFGLAVLVIIAGALAVPWQRMEQLAKQPNIKAARFAADLLFREVHTGTAQTNPADTARPTWENASAMYTRFPRPRLFVVQSPTDNFKPDAGTPDAVAVKALQQFRERPQDSDFGQVDTLRDPAGDANRLYRYAAAIRLEASCLACHSNYASWVPG